MDYLLWLLAAGAALGLLLFPLLRRADRSGPPSGGAAARPAPVPKPAAAPAEIGLRAQDIPAELRQFKPVHADDLPPERQQEILRPYQSVPRPPRLLQHLLSPDFLAEASSAQLVDLINAEPLIAAKLLAAVNSPMYSLSRPATDIEKAVMVLGVQAVRAICLQYILIAAFDSEDAARARRLESTWLASALASELVQHLAQELGFERPGELVGAVVLSFLGRLAVKGNAPEQVLARIPRQGFLERTRAEQQHLGLSAGEIGRLLMREWGVPAAVVEAATEIDAVLTRPADEADARAALCYFCARVGERLASGEQAELTGLEVLDEAPLDFFHFRGQLAHPRLRLLGEALRASALRGRLRHLRAALTR